MGLLATLGRDLGRSTDSEGRLASFDGLGRELEGNCDAVPREGLRSLDGRDGLEATCPLLGRFVALPEGLEGRDAVLVPGGREGRDAGGRDGEGLDEEGRDAPPPPPDGLDGG